MVLTVEALAVAPSVNFASFLATMLGTYAVAAHRPLRPALLAPVINAIGVSAMLFRDPDWHVFELIFPIAYFGGAWGAGRLVRAYREQHEASARLAGALAVERDARARQAVAEERARIARELHDIVSHGVSTMVLQAEGAEALWERDPHRAREMLLRIQEGGRESMVELRRLLGLLRTSDEQGGAGPPPGIGDLEDLVGSLRAGGMPVDLQVDGAADAVPAALQLTVYRIVQEGLTNTLKHSGPVPASVRVAIGQPEIIVEVVDSGRGDAAGPGSGYGLVGLSERVTLFGGEIHAGPGPGGGFVLRALLPLRPGAT